MNTSELLPSRTKWVAATAVLMCLGLPLPIVVQSLTKGLFFIGVMLFFLTNRKTLIEKFQASPMQAKRMVLCFVLFVASAFLSTALNAFEPKAWSEFLKFFLVHLLFLSASILLYLSGLPLAGVIDQLMAKYRIRRIWVTILAIVTLTALSQWWIGWRIEGVQIVESEHRARGFFSHPLTLAYLILWFWPLVLIRTLEGLNSKMGIQERSIRLFELMICVVLLILSLSLTVQAVVALETFAILLLFLGGRARIAALVTASILAFAIVFTTNPVSHKIKETFNFSQVSGDRSTQEYASDRFIFWLAHMELAKVKPLFGHGLGLSKTTREKGYQMIGMGDFEKKFEAHNLFIEILAETGLIGLFLFLASYMAWIFWMRKILCSKYFRVFLISALGFLLASLTQNTLFDSEVRYAWIVFAIVLTLMSKVNIGRNCDV